MSDTKLGFFCEHDEHETCPHKTGTTFSLLPKSKSYDLLCTCSCHNGCPLGGETQAPEPAWFETCTCPASEPWRENIRRSRAESEVQRKRQEEVMASIALGRGRSASEIQAMILAEYEARGWETPTDYGWESRLMAAGTAHRARGLRVLAESARGLNAARKWLREAGADNDSADDE